MNAPSSIPSRAAGESIYIGRVFPLKGDAIEPTFVYERRVEERADLLASTHVTRGPSGAIAVFESATHTADYALVDYTLHENQRGQTGSIHVEGDRVRFRLVDGSRVRTEVEGVGGRKGAIVVGPTLVGYIVRHLEELRGKQRLDVRLAVLERLETIGFELATIDAEPGHTRVEMKASSFLIRLLVHPIRFTFESATGKLLRLEGRVPPKVLVGDAWKDFDARVEYRFVASAYR